jgi:Uma2 family endonuclease
MTTEELLALPDDGVERWLIHGQLRENPRPLVPGKPLRNRTHSRIMVRAAYLLESWRDQQPEPRGSVLCGQAGCRLRRDPDLTVGIDVVYISAELAARQTDETRLIDGVPVLVIEILSPTEVREQIGEKIDGYLQAGVQLVWVINPHDRTVLIYRPGAKPELVNVGQDLRGEPHLPGFRVPASQLFA